MTVRDENRNLPDRRKLNEKRLARPGSDESKGLSSDLGKEGSPQEQLYT